MVTGLLYGAFTVARWWGNPMGALVPNAYTEAGLVPAAVVAAVLLGMVFPYRSELVGARLFQPLPWLSAIAGFLQCLVAMSAVWTGAFARPLSDATSGLALWAGYRRYRRRLYDAVPPASPSAAGD